MDGYKALTGLKAGVSREITTEHNPPSRTALWRGSCRFHPRAKSSGFSATANKTSLWAVGVYLIILAQGGICAGNGSNTALFPLQVSAYEADHQGIAPLMRAWAYVQDINKYASHYSAYEYELCVYTAVGMLLCAQVALHDLQKRGIDDECAYAQRLLWSLEQEYKQLRCSILQSRIIKGCFADLTALSQGNNTKFSAGQD